MAFRKVGVIALFALTIVCASVDKATLEVVPIEKWGDASLFYDEMLKNYALFFTTFEDYECGEACRALGYGEQSDFNDVCRDECTMYKYQVDQDLVDIVEEFEDQTEGETEIEGGDGFGDEGNENFEEQGEEQFEGNN